MLAHTRYPNRKRFATATNIAVHAVLICIVLLATSSNSGADFWMVCSSVNARAVSLDDRHALMREDGAILTTKPYCTSGEYAEGVIPFGLCVAGHANQFDYLTPEGRLVLTISAKDAGSFSEGLAAIQNETGEWGYVNKLGEFVIPQQFYDAAAIRRRRCTRKRNGRRRKTIYR